MLTKRKFYTYAYPIYSDPRQLLVYKETGQPVRIGDEVTLRDGEIVTVASFRPPHKSSSSGHVTVKLANGNVMEYYANVISAEWIE
jgi:hypothetical protein